MTSLPPLRIESGSSDETGARAGLRILLVEDDPGSQDLLRALCESRGDRVEIAVDGFQGLRCLSDGHHDVVLVDYHLPEMDGYALARLMRELPRPAGRLRLVGITADRHGLAARRGADRLFDAILVKPLRPVDLFATLDRVAAVGVPQPARDPADELWARRGLSERPTALLFPEGASGAVEALSQVFRIVPDADAADLVLVADEAGLDPLQALRATGPRGLLPSVALTERLGPACDCVFQVGDPEAWTAVAAASRGFRERRAALEPTAGRDAAGRLLALLAVAERSLTLHRAPTRLTYETGDTPAGRMAAILALAGAGLVRSEPHPDGLSVHLTEAGRASVLRGAAPAPLPLPSRAAPASGTRSAWTSPAVTAGAPPAKPWSAPRLTEGRPAPATATDDTLPVVNPRRMAELGDLIGDDHVRRLRQHLSQTLTASFGADTDPATLARQAHILIAAAGSLGFEHLAACCRTLQSAIQSDRDPREALGQARDAARAALSALSAMT